MLLRRQNFGDIRDVAVRIQIGIKKHLKIARLGVWDLEAGI